MSDLRWNPLTFTWDYVEPSSSASEVASTLANSALSIVNNLYVPNITSTSTASYSSTKPTVNYYSVLPPTEPSYPDFNVFEKPVFDSIDLYLKYTSEFLNQIRAYLDVNSDGLNDTFKSNTYTLEDSRLNEVRVSSVSRITDNKSVFSYPVNDVLGATDKISAEFDFETAFITRTRNIETAKRLIEQAKYVVTQGAEIEKTLMMYGPELALEKAKTQGIQASAYSSAVSSISTEVNAITELFRAQIAAYSAEGKSQQAYSDILLQADLANIALNKSVATIQAIADKVYVENQANQVSLAINADASTASVAAHGASGALAANYTSMSTNIRSASSNNSNTITSTETSTLDSVQDIYEIQG